MPCIKCSNGKWKYGVHGKCQFDTKKKCEDAAAAIHIGDEKKNIKTECCKDCAEDTTIANVVKAGA